MANYRTTVGVDNIYYALLTQDDASAYAAATPAYLAPAMNISMAPAGGGKIVYADNQPLETLQAEGETKITCEITGLPLDVLAALMGRVYDTASGRLLDNGGTRPTVALGFRSKKSDGLYRYYWFLKGTFATPPEDMASQADTPDPKSTKLEFTAIRTTYQFAVTGSLNDSVKRVVGDTSDVNFTTAATWFASVQLPSVGAPPAFTATPSPTNGAIAQAITVPITLTFSNALAGNAELGVTLTRVDTGAIFAVTRSLNSTRKILTLTHAALTATKQYFITLSGVKDAFGQTLPDTVYNFTCA